MKNKLSIQFKIITFTTAAMLIIFNAQAQKKLVTVTESSLTGVVLPLGSKQDSRLLSVLAGKALLETETKKTNTTISKTEILYLPGATGFNSDSLVSQLSSLGWNITPVEKDNKYVWLKKDNRNIITFFFINKKEINLYFGEVSTSPFPANGANNNPNNQNTEVINQQNTQQNNQQQPVQNKNTSVKQDGFTFTTTNFDNGWVATEQEDWVEVTKGTNKILIHYPNKQADAYNSVVMDGLKNAWDVLVAPRYSSASNFEFKPITGWQTIEFAEADMVEKETGNTVYIVLFKMNYSNGSGKYLEFITPDKRSFEQEFGPYHQTTYGWEKMENMAFLNKFAVAATDLNGKWTNDFSGAIQYVNAYTGFDAGMDTHASAENFQFSSNSSYNWDLGVASGPVGNIKFQSRKSSGSFSMTGNWKVNFSDIEGKPRSYDIYFSCIKGLRILWMDNRPFAKAE